jgi:signal transduction histidine kinase
MMKIKMSLSRRSIYLIIGIGLFVLASLNFTGWLFLQSFKTELVKELKRQILNTSQIGSRLISGNDLETIFPGMERSPKILYYQQLLYDIKVNNELENIVLIDLTGRLLVDYRINYTIGDTLFTFPLQTSLLREASIGERPEPILNKFADQYFLSAYLPIHNDYDEPVAILVVDAPLKFFLTLQRFELGTIYLGVAGLIILILFSLIIIIATRRLFMVEDQMKEQEQLAQLGQMAASVAHEIRNPLSIMKGTADILRKKYQDLSDEMLTYIPEEIDRLNRLVEDFLLFARQRKLDVQKVNLNATIQEFSDQFQDSRIQLQLDDKLPRVWADRHALRQILLNLIHNALDAIDKKGRVDVRVTDSSQKSGRLILEILDNGMGISEKDKIRVFEPFFSTKASGSGLGLAISKQLLEQMGGSISIESDRAKGTLVKISLKIA